MRRTIMNSGNKPPLRPSLLAAGSGLAITQKILLSRDTENRNMSGLIFYVNIRRVNPYNLL